MTTTTQKTSGLEANPDDLESDLFAALDESDLDDVDEGDGAITSGHTPGEPSTPFSRIPADEARAPYALTFTPHLTIPLRPYQHEAIAAWLDAGARGIVTLPTGAGKTVVALAALAELRVRTLVVVPTIELLRQWREGIRERLGVPD
ncbi:MAG TPA: DEAD/DEAH box helicase family protein, partial [Ktedonobacterales bacterium]|nr:DEAD/DEAH box helicase family protein [Ktedonobacterales bacterium]